MTSGSYSNLGLLKDRRLSDEEFSHRTIPAEPWQLIGALNDSVHLQIGERRRVQKREIRSVSQVDKGEPNMMSEREKNIKTGHKIPIGTLVETKWDEWFGGGACCVYHARLFVYEHHRDCDGTPLYLLSERGIQETDYIKGALGAIDAPLHGGFPEEVLTVVDKTPGLHDGEDALTVGNDD
jgi:hypothetical protein